MEAAENPPIVAPAWRQPKPWVRWLAVILAAAGWYVSWELLRVSAGERADPLLAAVCGGAGSAGAPDDCASVLTSPQAYVPLSQAPGAPRLPVSAFGMAYFAFVALWYLFVGPPAYARRQWHGLIALVVALGAWQSASYINIMHSELHRWCRGCLAVHALNGGLVLLTLLAYPWRRPSRPALPHPTPRLALAAATAGVLALCTHLALAYVVVAANFTARRTAEYEAVVSEPAYILWDFNRQPVIDIPLYDDEILAGSPDAPNTVVVFGDFQCKFCKQSHELLRQVAQKYPDRLRVAFRYYPQDPECNPSPHFREGAHASACRAARAAEAARMVGGRDGYLAMRSKLWDAQDELPTRPYAAQSPRERRLLEDWAAAIGLDRAAFAAAMDAPVVTARIQADVALAQRLGLQAMPVVYVNGKKLRGWSKPETWDAILDGVATSASAPTSAPASR